MTNEKAIYYNQPTLEFLAFAGKVKVFMAGRGTGKTRAIPEDILDRAEALPRARIFLASSSYDAIDSNIMPEIRDVFKLHGLVEDEDFVVDRMPPPHFEKPFKEIEDPRNSIHLFNGFAIQKVSFAKNFKRYRGRSFDGGIIDEALNFKGWDVDNVLLPTLRGFDFWGNNKYWKMMSIYSSYPRTAEGSWFLRYQELAKKYPELYYWQEATALDNLAVVGEEYIEDQRASLNYVDFNIEILNKGATRDMPSLFYYQFRESKHTYHAKDMRDVVSDESLALSFDFGGRYSCLTVSQHVGEEERFVYEFDTNNLTPEEEAMGKVKKVPDLVRDFCDRFKHHPVRYVEIWGDRSGLNQQQMDEKNLYESIEDALRAHGWQPTTLATQQNTLHKSRYIFMNTCFEENVEGYPAIRINAATCPNLVEALGRTRVTDDFKKDKKDERNVHYNQSHAPHLTDTIDYKIFNKYYYLLDDEFAYIPTAIEGGIDSL
jgi:hypothetical protein